MLFMKYVYVVQGGHTHINVYAGQVAPDFATAGYTLGKCGSLVFRNEEFTAFKQAMGCVKEKVYAESLVIQFIEHKHD